MDIEEKNGYNGSEGADNRNDGSERRDGDGQQGYQGREAEGEQRPFRPRYNSDDQGERRPFRPRYDEQQNDRPYRPRYNSDDQGERRPFRPRYDEQQNDRPYRPRYNSDDQGERRPFRPRYDEQQNDRPYRPRYNSDDQGERRPFRPRYDEQQNDRPYRPRYNSDDQGERRPFRPRYDEQQNDRPFRPRYNSDDQGERRPFRPRYDEQQNDRPFRPRYNSDDQGERRPFRPRYDEQQNDRPFRPRYNSDDQGERRPFRPRYNDDQGERSFRPRFGGDRGGRGGRFGGDRGGRFGGGRGPQRQGRPQQSRPQWKVANPDMVGPRYKIDSRIFDNEQEDQAYGKDPDMMTMPETLRLNRFIAMSGVCSRREADELIKAGKIKVDGQVVTEMGVTVSPDANVEYNGKQLKAEKKVYVLLNKPKDCVTTTDDPEGRRTVMDIVANASQERIYPVGRLDRNTTGILLLTNDGDMAEKLMHPKYEVRKIYHVFLDKPVAEEDLDKLVKGVELEDGPINADEVSYVDGRDRAQVGIVIHSGRNRVVRRMFESLGYDVVKLDRVYYGGLTKLNVPRGHWRYLTDEEINRLKAGFTK